MIKLFIITLMFLLANNIGVYSQEKHEVQKLEDTFLKDMQKNINQQHKLQKLKN